MKILVPVVFLLFAAMFIPSCHAAAPVSYAYIVDSGGMVRYVSSDAKTNESLSDPDFALSVSVGSDGSVWVLSTDQGNADRGGNLIKVKPKGSYIWKTVKIDEGVEANAVSGDASGGAWIIDGESFEAVLVSQSGKIQYASDQGPFMAISASFSDTNPSSNQIWGILSEAIPNFGNPVFYLTSLKGSWTGRGVAARALSGFWLVKSDGSVVTAAPDSSSEAIISPPNTASSISVGPSGSIWVQTPQPNIDQGGAFLKVWDQQGVGADNWVEVPIIGARSVSAE